MGNLSDLGPGESGVVVGWAGGVPSPRLLEMGILEGTEIEVIRLAPLGDPIEIGLRGYHLSIRKSEAEQIEIAPSR
jgi:ferrous iron transport protein A